MSRSVSKNNGRKGLTKEPRKNMKRALNTTSLTDVLKEKVIGQQHVIETIVPYIEMYQAELQPEGRPAGVFALLGPTGVGKTFLVECVAEVLHGDRKNVLKVDCGEFAADHEVAKLIGAPPGYVAHKETAALLCQKNITAVTSAKSKLAVVLFDEIEKAAPSMHRMLLGILDKGTLHLGDNTVTSFENALIFFTSNVGSQSVTAMVAGNRFSFDTEAQEVKPGAGTKSTVVDMKRRFTPEFINRIDEMCVFNPLSPKHFDDILDLELDRLRKVIKMRMGSRSFDLDVEPAARKFLLEKGISKEYGARELKRIINRYVLQPCARILLTGKVQAGATIRMSYKKGATELKPNVVLVMSSRDEPPTELELQLEESLRQIRTRAK
jgi:ATP-dependent Clp protease ATP-binding subunit ClpC